MKKSKHKVAKQTQGSSILNSSDGLPTPEEIRQRAYQIYLAQGGSDGRGIDDWLQAERELTAGNDKPVAT